MIGLYLLLFLIFVLSALFWYTEIHILFFLICLMVLLLVIYLSYVYENWYILGISVIIFLILLPTIYFYVDLGMGIYPYMTHKKNQRKEMKEMCSSFLDRHFKWDMKGHRFIPEKSDGPVIYVLNHHCKNNQLIDLLGHLKIPGSNYIVVTGGKTRWEIIDNLYSNMKHIKLTKEENGNTEIFLKECGKKLRAGKNLIIFPEGKFTSEKKKWRELKGFQTGAFLLSKKYNVPIVPVIISGDSYDYGLIWNAHVLMQYLPSIYPFDYSSAEEMRDHTLQLMNEKLSLL